MCFQVYACHLEHVPDARIRSHPGIITGQHGMRSFVRSGSKVAYGCIQYFELYSSQTLVQAASMLGDLKLGQYTKRKFMFLCYQCQVLTLVTQSLLGYVVTWKYGVRLANRCCIDHVLRPDSRHGCWSTAELLVLLYIYS